MQVKVKFKVESQLRHAECTGSTEWFFESLAVLLWTHKDSFLHHDQIYRSVLVIMHLSKAQVCFTNTRKHRGTGTARDSNPRPSCSKATVWTAVALCCPKYYYESNERIVIVPCLNTVKMIHKASERAWKELPVELTPDSRSSWSLEPHVNEMCSAVIVGAQSSSIPFKLVVTFHDAARGKSSFSCWLCSVYTAVMLLNWFSWNHTSMTCLQH